MGLYTATSDWHAAPGAFTTDWEHKPHTVRVRPDPLAIHPVLIVYLLVPSVLIGGAFGPWWAIGTLVFGIALLAIDLHRHRLEFDYPFVRHKHMLGLCDEQLRASLVRVELKRNWFGTDEHGLQFATRDGRFVVDLGATQHGAVVRRAGLRRLMAAIEREGARIDDDVRSYLQPLSVALAANSETVRDLDVTIAAQKSAREAAHPDLVVRGTLKSFARSFITFPLFAAGAAGSVSPYLGVAAALGTVALLWLLKYLDRFEIYGPTLRNYRLLGMRKIELVMPAAHAELQDVRFLGQESHFIKIQSKDSAMSLPLDPLKKTGAYAYSPPDMARLLHAFEQAGGNVDARVKRELRRISA